VALSDYEPERATVAFRGGAFDVRGLTFDDLSLLLRAHYDDLAALVQLYDDNSSDFLTGRGLDRFVLKLATDAPGLVASILVLATDTRGDESEAKARGLPFPLVVDALGKVGRLTFEEAGGLANFLTTAHALLGNLLPPSVALRLVPSSKAA
jgi:hypothetical protein